MLKKSQQLTVEDISVQVIRKKIKNFHLSVRPPEGEVRISAPIRMGDEAIRKTVLARLDWIRKHQSRFRSTVYRSPHQFITGEEHFVFGTPYILEVREHDGPPRVRILPENILELKIKYGTETEKRRSILDQWYREKLSEQVPGLIQKWEPIIDRQVKDWRIKKMKTRWGTCNIQKQRIWLNLELAKKPIPCLEYLIVHEMTHLHERLHNQRFKMLMDRFLPNWRILQKELKEIENTGKLNDV